MASASPPAAATAPASSAESSAEMTLYFYPSPGLNWESPASLSLYTVRNELLRKPRAIGHVSIEISCPKTPQGQAVQILTGMSQQTKLESMKLMLLKGYGFGIMFHDFKGALEDPRKLRPELESRFKSGNLSFLNFKINQQTCERLAQYIQEYDQRDYDLHYGLPNRPRYGEGSGCSAFGASFLDVAGLLDAEYRDQWTRVLRVPLSYIGGPLTDQYVSIFSTFFASKWANENEPHRSIYFWDPDLMHAWVKKIWDQQIKNPNGVYHTLKKGNAIGLSTDRRHVSTPKDSIWKNEIKEAKNSSSQSRSVSTQKSIVEAD